MTPNGSIGSMTLVKLWGNPAVQTFKKRYIRPVTVGKVTVFVHKDIANLVHAYLTEIQVSDKELESWAPSKDPKRLVDFGLAIEAPAEQAEGYEVGGETAAKYGLRYHGGWIEFTGTPEEAQELSDKAEAARLAPPPAAPRQWSSNGPGTRPLVLGDKGDDVYFFQLVVGCPTIDGVFGESTAVYASMLSKRYGLPELAEVTGDTWKTILPDARSLSRAYLERGSTGLIVRVLQAGLVAYDWAHDLRVTGRFDRDTDIAIRNLQTTMGLRVTGKVRLPEWTAVLNRKLDT